MAVISNKAQKYPFYLGYVSPHVGDKKVRDSLYVASSVAVALAALRYGTTKVGFLLGTAGLFAQGYQIVQLAREFKASPLDQESSSRTISQITDRVFTMSLICGIVMSGLTVSQIYQESALLLQTTHLLRTPSLIPSAWLQNAPSVTFHMAKLASIVCFAIPYKNFFFFNGDGHFFGIKQPSKQIDALCTNLLNTWLLKNTLEVSDLWESFVKAFPQITVHVDAFKKSLLHLTFQFVFLLLSEGSFQGLHDRIAYFSNPKPNRLFPRARKRSHTDWGIIKHRANQIFFHTFNLSLMGARLYHQPFPTTIYFGLGLMYPTSIQKEKTIKRTWEVVPDFIGMPIVTKCRYLFDRFSSTAITLVWWNIPGACLNGLYLAEDFRFYGRRFCQ